MRWAAEALKNFYGEAEWYKMRDIAHLAGLAEGQVMLSILKWLAKEKGAEAIKRASVYEALQTMGPVPMGGYGTDVTDWSPTERVGTMKLSRLSKNLL